MRMNVPDINFALDVLRHPQGGDKSDIKGAIDIALNSLKAWKEVLEQESVLDKIKDEIIEEKDCAYADFERYKVEYLGRDLEDDFRYGMERCIEIIDKYKAESEE